MNQDMQQVLKDEAMKYAVHYFPNFFSKAESENPISFANHYKELKFSKRFFYGIVFKEQPFLQYLDEKRSEVYRMFRGNDEKMEQANEEVEEELLQEVSKVYKEYYVSMYLELLNEKLTEYQEELTYATEDADYYRERKYVGEEDDIGGPVSEEERLSLIQENEKNIEKYTARMNTLRGTKNEIERYASVCA